MSKECKLSNDAYSQTVFQLSTTCIWTKIFNLKNMLFNKWIALDSRTCLYIYPLQKILNKMIYNVWPLQKILWNIDIHTCLLDSPFLCPHLLFNTKYYEQRVLLCSQHQYMKFGTINQTSILQPVKQHCWWGKTPKLIVCIFFLEYFFVSWSSFYINWRFFFIFLRQTMFNFSYI